jgi:hypothetical protein
VNCILTIDQRTEWVTDIMAWETDNRFDRESLRYWCNWVHSWSLFRSCERYNTKWGTQSHRESSGQFDGESRKVEFENAKWETLIKRKAKANSRHVRESLG